MGKYTVHPYYTLAVAIVHGESEEQIVRHIRSKLRLNIYIHKRPTSIQINGLVHELQTNFKNITALKKKNGIILPDKNKITTDNFKIFTIMDTDDCSTEKIKNQYIDRSLFNSYLLKDYLTPIYDTPDLEHVLFNGGIIPKIFKDNEKMKKYVKIFPIAQKPSSGSSINEMQNLSDILKQIPSTNMEIFLDYCIEQANKKKINL